MKNETKDSPALLGAIHAQRLGATSDANPFGKYPDDASEEYRATTVAAAEQWEKGWKEANDRLIDLFEAWLALGHSIPLLAMGKAGQALGPMVSGLVASNGNTAGVILAGALAAHEGKTLREILPDRENGRRALEACQYGILGVELPAGGLVFYYRLAAEIERFRTGATQVGKDPDDLQKVARVEFDLGQFLRVLVEGLPPQPLTVVPNE